MNYKELPILKEIIYDHRLYKQYKNENNKDSQFWFIIKNYCKTKIISGDKRKAITKLIDTVDVSPVISSIFFYSIDFYKTIDHKNQILDNYSIDYSWAVNESLDYLVNISSEAGEIVLAFQRYVSRVKRKQLANKNQIDYLESLFKRPAAHFEEALQRILFVNQWLWQTGHKHNGFGHLDWMLFDLYKDDIENGVIDKKKAKVLISEFFYVLHANCWYKSTNLLGDTGQIIILGGNGEDGIYKCNELTYLFIEISMELKLPDPKVLLRVSGNMPDNLLYLAMDCISTGIGAPFLSNDDAVIPALIQFGYDREDAYNYVTSACWEPLILGKSCDQNNIRTINFCKPFVDYLDSEDFNHCGSISDIKTGYYSCLDDYIDKFLVKLDSMIFEEDPILTTFSPFVLNTGKDIVRGGAQYSNLGLTTVGLSTVVNSMLALDQIVFTEKRYSIREINIIRMNNFEGYEELRCSLNMARYAFGNDSSKVTELTNELLRYISNCFQKHSTKLGGKYKYGLSSPNYIVDARDIGATFDGRKAGTPFETHISGKNGLAPTELISFASMLDYSCDRINGNVVDFMMSPSFLKDNMDKAVMMIKTGIRKGFYQLQINVVDSKVMIEAQKNPEKFRNLVVRVWGFSAYFNDLPKSYQDHLIKRALEAEIAS